jgi:hypothetical protein
MKEKITKFEKDCINEIKSCDEYLKDLPEDIENIDELNEVIGNNKDMSRAYDLGRKEAFEEVMRQIKS